MTKEKAVNMKDWLARIDRIQNIDRYSDLANVDLSDLIRTFLSMELKQVLSLGYYDTTTEKFVLGVPTVSTNATVQNDLTTDVALMKDVVTNIDTTSTGSKEWTVTAGKQWVIIHCGHENSTRGSQKRLSITPSGGSETIVANTNANPAAGAYVCMLPGNWYQTSASVNPPLILDAGDKIKIYDEGFIAADTVAAHIAYIEVTP